jgi:pimeloyl-ACP methyl ester carboxylesterase
MPAVEHVGSVDGTRIAYRASGSGAGPPLVLVHGTGTSGADWAFVQRLLRDRFTVVTMDRRGRGESGDGPDYSMEREAEDILAVLDAVGAELLVGHSYGALCSILAADRTELRRLVLYEPPIAIRANLLGTLEELVDRGDLDAALEGFLRGAGVPDEQFEMIRSSPAWPTLRDAAPTIPRELRAGAEWPRPRGPIEVPMLYLLGGDTDNPAYLDGLDGVRALFPDSRLERIPGQRHIAHVFVAEAVAELVASFCDA